MKRRLIHYVLLLTLAGVDLGPSKAFGAIRFSAGVEINAVSDFYNPLAGYGSWVDVGSYGHCWHPRVVSGWRPYTDGHWEWTDVGWYWVSDDPWGWACYHYGSWVFDSYYGWIWVPGTEWASAWVTWRESDDYIGWAPCGPGGAVLAPSFFVFVDARHFHDRIRPDRVIVNNTRIINRTTVVNNFSRETRDLNGVRQTVVVSQGPQPALVQRATGTRLTARPITQVARETPIPSTIRHASWRERVIQEPSPTGRPQRQIYSQPEPRTTPSRQQAPMITPPVQRREPAPKETAPVVPQRPATQPAPQRPAQVIPQRPPSQVPPERPVGPPTGRDRGYPSRERDVNPPARVAPPLQEPPRRVVPPNPNVPPPEQARPERDRDKDKDRP